MAEKRKRDDSKETIGPAPKTHSRTIRAAPVTYLHSYATDICVARYKSVEEPAPAPAPSIGLSNDYNANLLASLAPVVRPPPQVMPLPPKFPMMVNVEPPKRKRVIRAAAGEVWEDSTLADWPDDDYRIFCGDLGNEVHDEMLKNAFSRYPSLQRVRVLRDKKSGKSRGFGFVSFSDPHDFVNALREMNGKYVGNRPCKLRKSNWEKRAGDVKMLHAANAKK